MYLFAKGIAGLSVPKIEAESQSPETEVASRLKNTTKNFRYQLVRGGSLLYYGSASGRETLGQRALMTKYFGKPTEQPDYERFVTKKPIT